MAAQAPPSISFLSTYQFKAEAVQFLRGVDSFIPLVLTKGEQNGRIRNDAL
jgi:hypothetical protein